MIDNLSEKTNKVDHNQNVIEIRNISFAYESEVNVLENVSLDIHRGDYIGLVGPNGSGKTTLLKIMLGLLEKKEGSIKVFGEDISSFKDWHRISYVPQRISGFEKSFPITVLEVVSLGAYVRKNFLQKISEIDPEMPKKVLKKLNMWDYRDKLLGDLSGGQIQRVFIARALVNNPEIIFLDEPTTGIDVASQNSFYNLLQDLNAKMGITLVMVSHDIERLTKEVMHIVCVNKTLTCHTTPEDFIKDSHSANLFGEKVRIITHHKHN